MKDTPACLYCGKSDNEIPLVNLTFKSQPMWICSTHLPILIHEPEKLADRLEAALKKS